MVAINLTGRFRWVFSRRLVLQLTATAAAIVQVGILLQAVSRGLDYIGLPAYTSVPTLAIVERALPLDLSGWLFVGSATIAFVGLVLRQTPLAAVGHMMIAVLYGMFATGALVEVFDRDPVSGWRTATAWVIACLMHVVFARASETSWRVARAQ